jgi:hypothetical protein
MQGRTGQRLRPSLALALLLSLGPVLSPAQAQSVANTRSLDFGRFVAGAGGSISIDTSGVRTHAGSVILLPPGGTSATFNVSDPDPANASKAYVIGLPDNGTVTLTSGADSMALTNFVSNPSAAGALVGGSQTVTVGATLTVGLGQAPGNYSGSFNVTVIYQ